VSGAPALKIAVAGAGGRMGGTVTAALAEARDLNLSGALLAPGDPREGHEVGAPPDLPASGVRFTTDPAEAIGGADVLIDFSLPEGTMTVLEVCLDAGLPLVCGVTGLDEASRDRLRAAGGKIPVLLAANMSVGVNLMIHLSRVAAAALPGFDAEISEIHHRFKRDAPSGTALAIGEAVDQGRGGGSGSEIGRGPGDGPRETGAIGYASLRAGDVVGEHTLLLAGDGERLEITHRAGDRMAFAAGALRAARWLAGRPPGFYGMDHVLGLTV
jgi:4-hydroxy-tetrahydrodipicolinate reductase